MPDYHPGAEVIDVVNDPDLARILVIFGGHNIRLYANAPVALPMRGLGAFSVTAFEPRQLTHVQRVALDDLAFTICACQLNPATGAFVGTLYGNGSDLNRLAEQQADLVVLAGSSGEIGYVSEAPERHVDGASPMHAGTNLLDSIAEEGRASVAVTLREVMRRSSSATRVGPLLTDHVQFSEVLVGE